MASRAPDGLLKRIWTSSLVSTIRPSPRHPRYRQTGNEMPSEDLISHKQARRASHLPICEHQTGLLG